MLLRLFLNGDFKNGLITLLLMLPAVCLCLSAHEAAHGLMAYALGDRTAKDAGRLTLDPMAHMDPAGFLCMLLIGFGWAQPVPVNIGNFKIKNRKLGMALTALAGPACNLLMAAVFIALSIPAQMIGGKAGYILVLFCYYASLLSVSLGVFNLIPIYPLDGSRLLDAVLPLKWMMFLRKHQAVFLLILVAILWFGLLSVVTSAVYGWIATGVYALLGF